MRISLLQSVAHIEPGCHDRKPGQGLDNVSAWIATLTIVSVCFQDMRIADFGSFALKPFHLFVLAVVIYTMLKRKSQWEIPALLFSVGLLIVFAISLFDYARFGLKSEILNYLFMYFTAIGLYNLGARFSLKDWKIIVQRAALFVMVAVYIKLVINFDAVRYFLTNSWGGHPVIPTFLGGGVNLEASWLALFIVFFDADCKGKLYSCLAIVLSMTYASRAGFLVCLLAIMYVFIYRKGNKGLAVRFGVSLALLLLVFAALLASGNTLIERFASLGEDRGSLGRLNMWQYAFDTFIDAPIFGNGAGNATIHMSQVAGIYIPEGNVHLYLLQVLLDFGLIGLIIFVAMVVSFLMYCIKTRLNSPFCAYILIYLLISFIQFRGGDVLLGFALAGYFLGLRQNATGKATDVFESVFLGQRGTKSFSSYQNSGAS